MDTVGEPGVSPIGPSRKTLCPALPSLQWVPWVAVPHLPRYYAPLRLPPARLGSLHSTFASRYRAASLRSWCPPRAHGLVEAPRSRQDLWSTSPQSEHDARRQMVLPSSRVIPLKTCPALRPRWCPAHSPVSHTGLLPSGACKPSALASMPLRLSC